MNKTQQVFENIFAQAESLYTRLEVEQPLDGIAQKITTDFATKYPLILGVMNGALPTLGYLLPRLPFVLEVDYLHATRYRGQMHGSELIWKRHPEVSLEGRHVLLVDDILDRGITLSAIAEHCWAAGAADVKIAVLCEKKSIDFSPLIGADYIALQVPDRFVFGYGMDYEDHWRNAPGIYVAE